MTTRAFALLGEAVGAFFRRAEEDGDDEHGHEFDRHAAEYGDYHGHHDIGAAPRGD